MKAAPKDSSTSSSKSFQFEDIGASIAGGPPAEAARQSRSRSRRERRRRAEARLRLLLVKDGVALASHRGGPRHSPPARFSPPPAATSAPCPSTTPSAAEAWHSIPVLSSDVKFPSVRAVPPELVLDFVVAFRSEVRLPVEIRRVSQRLGVPLLSLPASPRTPTSPSLFFFAPAQVSSASSSSQSSSSSSSPLLATSCPPAPHPTRPPYAGRARKLLRSSYGAE